MPSGEPLLTGVSHVMLGVSQLQRSVAFFRDQLGLRVLQQIPGFAFFDGGGVQLVLSEAVFQALGKRTGAMEVVFRVGDVAAAHALLASRGVAFSRPPRQVIPNDWTANFEDPDGHHLSIFGPPASRGASA